MKNNNRMNLNIEDLEMVNGGTDQGTYDMAVLLTEKGYGNFHTGNPNGNGGYIINKEAVHAFLESKNYNFTKLPGSVDSNICHLPFHYDYKMKTSENQIL